MLKSQMCPQGVLVPKFTGALGTSEQWLSRTSISGCGHVPGGGKDFRIAGMIRSRRVTGTRLRPRRNTLPAVGGILLQMSLHLGIIGERAAACSTGDVEPGLGRCVRMFKGGVGPQRVFVAEFSAANAAHVLPTDLALHGYNIKAERA